MTACNQCGLPHLAHPQGFRYHEKLCGKAVLYLFLKGSILPVQQVQLHPHQPSPPAMDPDHVSLPTGVYSSYSLGS
ncbi:hypothetical protein LEMLEM_LOCUS15846 [Lemmus lemmus]